MARENMMSFAEMLGKAGFEVKEAEVRSAVECVKGYPETPLTSEERQKYGLHPDQSHFEWDMEDTYKNSYRNPCPGSTKTLLGVVLKDKGFISDEEFTEILKPEVLNRTIKYGLYPDESFCKLFGLETGYIPGPYTSDWFVVMPSGVKLVASYLGDYEQICAIKEEGNEDEVEVSVYLAEYLLKNPQLNVFNMPAEELSKIDDDSDATETFVDSQPDCFRYTDYAWRLFYVATGMITEKYFLDLYEEERKEREAEKEKARIEKENREYDRKYGEDHEASDRERIFAAIPRNVILSKGGKKKLESKLGGVFKEWAHFSMVKPLYGGAYLEVTTVPMDTPNGKRSIRYIVHI